MLKRKEKRGGTEKAKRHWILHVSYNQMWHAKLEYTEVWI